MTAPQARPRPQGAVLVTARWVVGHRNGRHCLIENGEVVFENGEILFVGRGFGGAVARRVDYGNALIGPALSISMPSPISTPPSSAMTTSLPGRRAASGRRNTSNPAPTRCILARNSRSRSAIPSQASFATASPRPCPSPRCSTAPGRDGAGIRGCRRSRRRSRAPVYLGPAYRTGNQVVSADGTIGTHYDEPRGLAELDAAIDFARRIEGSAAG